jgi:hypothetical protein
MLDYSRFNRLAVPFEMILDCGSSVEEVRVALLATSREVMTSPFVSNRITTLSYDFKTAVTRLISTRESNFGPRQIADRAVVARNLLMEICAA